MPPLERGRPAVHADHLPEHLDRGGQAAARSTRTASCASFPEVETRVRQGRPRRDADRSGAAHDGRDDGPAASRRERVAQAIITTAGTRLGARLAEARRCARSGPSEQPHDLGRADRRDERARCSSPAGPTPGPCRSRRASTCSRPASARRSASRCSAPISQQIERVGDARSSACSRRCRARAACSTSATSAACTSTSSPTATRSRATACASATSQRVIEARDRRRRRSATTVEGRNRFSVNVRYPARTSAQRPSKRCAQRAGPACPCRAGERGGRSFIPLGRARRHPDRRRPADGARRGRAAGRLRLRRHRPAQRDIGGYVDEAKAVVAHAHGERRAHAAGRALTSSGPGQYEQLAEMAARMKILVPLDAADHRRCCCTCSSGTSSRC